MHKNNGKDLHILIRFVGLNTIIHPLVTFCVSIIIARAIGPEGRGAYGVMVALVATLPVIASFGLANATQYFCANGSLNQASLLKTVSLAGMVIGTGVACSVFYAWWKDVPTPLLPAELGTAGIVYLSLTLFMSTITRLWTCYLAGQERYAYSTWGVTAGVVLQAVTLLAIWMLGDISLDIAAGVLALQAAFHFALFPVISWADLRKTLRAPLLSLSESGRMLGFCTWMYISNILGLVNIHAIILLLTVLSGLYETGLYTAAVGPAYLLLLFSKPLDLVMSTRATRRIGDQNFPLHVAASLRLIFCITGAVVLAGLFAAPAVIPWIYGADFEGAVIPFCILLPGFLALALRNVMVQYLNGSGRPRWSTGISATTAIVSLVMAFLLLPDHGAVGAALAVSVAYFSSTLVAFYAFLHFSGLEPRQLLVPRYSDWRPLARVLGITGPRC